MTEEDVDNARRRFFGKDYEKIMAARLHEVRIDHEVFGPVRKQNSDMLDKAVIDHRKKNQELTRQFPFFNYEFGSALYEKDPIYQNLTKHLEAAKQAPKPTTSLLDRPVQS